MKTPLILSVGGLVLAAFAACVALAASQTASGGDLPTPIGIEARFSALLSQVGQQYLTSREAIVDTGDAAVPFLERTAASDDWKEKTFADLLLWHTRSPAQAEELRDSFLRQAIAAIRGPSPRGTPHWWQQGFPTLRDHAQAVPFFAELLLKDRPDATGGSSLAPFPTDAPEAVGWVWQAKDGAIAILLETKDARVPAILTDFVTRLIAEERIRPLGRRAGVPVRRACSALGRVGDAHTVKAMRAQTAAILLSATLPVAGAPGEAK
ncbi:MAG: hypothetical protein ACE5JM_12095, partial [Armatimonadota bacterium]